MRRETQDGNDCSAFDKEEKNSEVRLEKQFGFGRDEHLIAPRVPPAGSLKPPNKEKGI